MLFHHFKYSSDEIAEKMRTHKTREIGGRGEPIGYKGKAKSILRNNWKIQH